MEVIDRKFHITATHLTKGTTFTSRDGVFFKAGDKGMVKMLMAYRVICEDLGAEENQLRGIDLLIERVIRYQAEYPEKCKVADIDPGMEEEYVCRPND